MSDLFGGAQPVAPLAEALRPKSIDDVVGQQHLLGPGKPLRLAFESGKPHSMILWGPPGSGKTTLARLMAKAFDAEFVALSAVFSGVKDIREAVQAAEARLEASGRHTILFVDEVHRFNKAQQDAFLQYVERGLITFVGATTENPSFEVNSALLSRATAWSGWRRSRATRKPGSTASAWDSRPPESRRWSSSTTSARPRAFASSTCSATRRPIRPTFASNLPRTPTSLGKNERSLR